MSAICTESYRMYGIKITDLSKKGIIKQNQGFWCRTNGNKYLVLRVPSPKEGEQAEELDSKFK